MLKMELFVNIAGVSFFEPQCSIVTMLYGNGQAS